MKMQAASGFYVVVDLVGRKVHWGMPDGTKSADLTWDLDVERAECAKMIRQKSKEMVMADDLEPVEAWLLNAAASELENAGSHFPGTPDA